jgi:hypothetical protein
MSRIARFKNIHNGETAVVIGNGPSLNDIPLNELGAKYLTFGSNKIYRKPFTPDYYCIIDEDMLLNCELPRDFEPREMFIRAEAGYGNPIYPVVLNGFSTDISNFVVMGGTCTYALLQIAFYMGIKTVLLVGVDHHYPNTGKFVGHKIVAGSKDPDHFDCADGKPYFDKGKTFNAPELEGTARSYAIADELFRKAGRKIINLTPGTHLDVFEKGKIKDWIKE